MKAPRPFVVAIVLYCIEALFLASNGIKGTGAEAAGYLFGSFVLPGLLAIAYAWWYRRRRREPG